MQRKTIDLFCLEKFSRKRLSTETLIKKLKRVVSEESELQHPAKSILSGLLWHECITERGAPAETSSMDFVCGF